MTESASHPDAEQIARLRRHVDRMAGLIGPRHIGRPKALEATVGSIESEFADAGYVIERQPYLAAGVEVANLVVEISGTHRPREIVILGRITTQFLPRRGRTTTPRQSRCSSR